MTENLENPSPDILQERVTRGPASGAVSFVSRSGGVFRLLGLPALLPR